MNHVALLLDRNIDGESSDSGPEEPPGGDLLTQILSVLSVMGASLKQLKTEKTVKPPARRITT
jgi:hypothetical protein